MSLRRVTYRHVRAPMRFGPRYFREYNTRRAQNPGFGSRRYHLANRHRASTYISRNFRMYMARRRARRMRYERRWRPRQMRHYVRTGMMIRRY